MDERLAAAIARGRETWKEKETCRAEADRQKLLDRRVQLAKLAVTWTPWLKEVVFDSVSRTIERGGYYFYFGGARLGSVWRGRDVVVAPDKEHLSLDDAEGLVVAVRAIDGLSAVLQHDSGDYYVKVRWDGKDE